ncbi:peptidoglycan recognition protein [Streptomyces mexicanus]|uniref:Peptidoglycan recognition protein n=2 Tax=Streptomyces mexicanus TaxID=178566 RepID=A0A7X1LV60_9ACTN|nr:peptidoglycan recognition protein [Streptomyces mexicanus]
MRRYGFLASSIGVTSTLTLALASALPATAATAAPGTVRTASSGTTAAATGPVRAAVPGSTQSLPLVPLDRGSRGRSVGVAREQGLIRPHVRHFSLVGVVWDDPGAELHGTARVRTRSAATGAWSAWQSLDTDNADHGADPGSAERAGGHVRGATAPLWVGDSDGVEVRVQGDAARAADKEDPGDADPPLSLSLRLPLPSGLRLELVDPGDPVDAGGSDGPGGSGGLGDVEGLGDLDGLGDLGGPGGSGGSGGPGGVGGLGGSGGTGGLDDAGGSGGTGGSGGSGGLGGSGGSGGPVQSGAGAGSAAGAPDDDQTRLGEMSEAATAASAANSGLAPLGATEIPALDREGTERELISLRGPDLTADQMATPYIGARPRIVTRRGWGADESLRAKGFVYTKKVKAVFVHHTVTGNSYRCSQTPSVIRSIYRYHVKSMGWRDIGYNFLVDKCGTIYEGRAGGVAKPVLGAHTMGFNSNTAGIAVIGTYSTSKPPAAAVDAVARLAAWKLGLYRVDPRGKTYLKSGGGNLYQKGKNVRLNVISGHRDGFATDCPGRQLYDKLGTIRSAAARYQGR